MCLYRYLFYVYMYCIITIGYMYIHVCTYSIDVTEGQLVCIVLLLIRGTLGIELWQYEVWLYDSMAV